MSDVLEIKTEGADIVASMIGKEAPKRLRASRTEAMNKSVNLLKSRLIADAARSKFTGEHASGIGEEFTGNPGSETFIGKVGSGVYYNKWVEYGRASGGFPNILKLGAWVSAKFGDDSLTYVIGKSIANKGTLKNKRTGYDTGWAHLRTVAKSNYKRVQGLWHESVNRAVRLIK